jgi:hypothetical protein
MKCYERRRMDSRINYCYRRLVAFAPLRPHSFATPVLRRDGCQREISIIESYDARPVILQIIMLYCATGTATLIYPFKSLWLLYNPSIVRFSRRGRCQLNTQWIFSSQQTKRQDWRGIRFRDEVLFHEPMFCVPLIIIFFKKRSTFIRAIQRPRWKNRYILYGSGYVITCVGNLTEEKFSVTVIEFPASVWIPTVCWKQNLVCRIWVSHSGDYEESRLLGCGAV